MHSKQFWKNPIVYCLGRWLKYFKFLPKKWRIWSEIKTFEFECEAYAKQLKFYVDRGLIKKSELQDLMNRFALWVTTKYNLTMFTKRDAYLKIFEYYQKL